LDKNNSLKNLFKMDINEAKQKLAYHEQNKTLLSEVSEYHPSYIIHGEVAKFQLIKDLGM
jgi:hypothetical protein